MLSVFLALRIILLIFYIVDIYLSFLDTKYLFQLGTGNTKKINFFIALGYFRLANLPSSLKFVRMILFSIYMLLIFLVYFMVGMSPKIPTKIHKLFFWGEGYKVQ